MIWSLFQIAILLIFLTTTFAMVYFMASTGIEAGSRYFGRREFGDASLTDAKTYCASSAMVVFLVVAGMGFFWRYSPSVVFIFPLFSDVNIFAQWSRVLGGPIYLLVSLIVSGGTAFAAGFGSPLLFATVSIEKIAMEGNIEDEILARRKREHDREQGHIRRLAERHVEFQNRLLKRLRSVKTRLKVKFQPAEREARYWAAFDPRETKGESDTYRTRTVDGIVITLSNEEALFVFCAPEYKPGKDLPDDWSYRICKPAGGGSFGEAQRVQTEQMDERYLNRAVKQVFEYLVDFAYR